MARKPTYEELKQRVKELEKYVEHYKKTEKELRESDHRYQSLLDNAPVGIWHASPDGSDGFINSKLMEITGLIPESAQGTGWASALHPEDRERVFGEWTNFIEGKAPYHSTYRFRHPNGEVRWVVGQAVPVIDTDSSLIGYIGTLTDITDRKQIEKALRFLSSVTEQVKDSVIVTNPGFEITYVNKATEDLYGYTLEELMGKTPDMLNVDPMTEKIQKDIYKTVASGKVWTGEHLNKRKDGSTFFCGLRISPLIDDEGQTSGYIGIQRDITKRKQAEEALQQSEARYRNIASSIPVVIYQFLLKKDGSYSSPYISESASSILDISAKEVIANPHSLFDRILKEDLDSVNKSIIESSRTMKTWFQEFGIKTKAGDVKWIRGVSIPHLLIEGEILWNGVLLDITDSKQAEDALRRSEEKFRNFLDNLGDVAYETDPKGNVTYASKMGENITGVPLKDIIGKPFLPLLAKESHEKAIDIYQRTLNGEKPEYELTFTNGKICQFKNEPLRDKDDKIIGVFGIARDITKRKQMENALRKAREELEIRVKERTESLEIKTKNLEEVNTALKVLLEKRDEDKTDIEEKVMANVKQLVVPYLEKLKTSGLNERQMAYADVLESNLDNIISPFSNRLSSKLLDLSPTEIRIANLVKHGRNTKEIAEMMGVSIRTIDTHRRNIRKKLGLNRKKSNLRTHLLSIQ